MEQLELRKTARNHRIGHSSLFFSTVYNKAYYIVSSVTIALLLEMVTTVNLGIDNTVMYWLAIIVYSISMYILYRACRKYRKQHGSYKVEQLSTKYITLRICIMLMYTVVVSMIISVIHIGILITSIRK